MLKARYSNYNGAGEIDVRIVAGAPPAAKPEPGESMKKRTVPPADPNTQVEDLSLFFRSPAMLELDELISQPYGNESKRIGILVGDQVGFSVVTKPASIELLSEIVWTPPILPSYIRTFNEAGTFHQTVAVRNESKTATITVRERPNTLGCFNSAYWPYFLMIYLTYAVEARDISDNLIKPSACDNGRHNAVKHALWNAIMSWEFKSRDFALTMSSCHEADGLLSREARHNETVMDLENNEIGATIGTLPVSRSDLAIKVISALDNGAGDLTILDEDCNGPVNSWSRRVYETGLLMPSNPHTK
jgi:hypothetical protein